MNGGTERDGRAGDRNGNGRGVLNGRIDARRRSDLITGMRRLAERPGPPPRPAAKLGSGPASAVDADEWCELCGAGLPSDHRHLIQLDERRLLCACETCWSVPPASRRPPGRSLGPQWLRDFDLPDAPWASFGILIGLAFFTRTGDPERLLLFLPESRSRGCPDGAPHSTKSSCQRVRAMNPGARAPRAGLRSSDRQPHGRAPSPRPSHGSTTAHRLVGMIKTSWGKGSRGGTGPSWDRAVLR